MFINKAFILILIMVFTPIKTYAFLHWMNNEIHYQYGDLDTPEFAGGSSENTHIITFQHADGWKYGDNFFFIDYLDNGNNR